MEFQVKYIFILSFNFIICKVWIIMCFYLLNDVFDILYSFKKNNVMVEIYEGRLGQ